MAELVIKNRRITESGNRVRINFTILGETESELWFELPGEYKDWLTDSYDAPVVGMLLPAMMQGRNIRVEGPMSDRLAWFLQRTVVPVLDLVHKDAKPVKIIGFTVSEPPTQVANAVAMGLSNGVDSNITIDDYGPNGSAPPELRLTHLIFNEVGAAGRFTKPGAAELSKQRLDNVKNSAAEIGLPLIHMSSNVDGLQGKLKHIDNHVLKNATTPLLLQRGIRTFLYSADVRWAEMTVKTDNISFTDPMLIPDLSTESLWLRSVGAEHTRVEKVLRVAELPLAQKHLDLCAQSYPNCSECGKCLPALATWEGHGLLENMSGRFNLDTYRRIRIRYAAWARFSPFPQGRIPAQFIKPNGFKEFLQLHSLIQLQRLDRLARKVPGYQRFAKRSVAGRLRRRVLYRIT